MALSNVDLKLLKQAIEAGHRLEKLWPSAGTSQTSEKAANTLSALTAFRQSLESLSRADSKDVSRLSDLQKHFTDTMTAKHLAAGLVPLERLYNRNLRDDEFLVSERDQTKKDITRGPLIVIADNIRSAFNVGAIFRTAECFALESVWLTGYTPTPDEDKTGKTSMGTDEYMPWRSLPKGSDAIEELKSQGYSLVALETVEGAKDLADFQWPEKTALLLGNERFGVDHELLAKADHIVRIPLQGQKNSLNVGIAFGIVCNDWRSKYSAQESAGNFALPKSKEFGSESQRSSDAPSASSTENAFGLSLNPIGFFRTKAVHPYEASRQASVSHDESIGEIELNKGQQFEQALQGLEGMERIWLLYQFHHNTAWKPMVMPPRGPNIKRGVFATRSPYRPNSLGLSCVELIKIDGLKLKVKGFDLLDGTPILDIKPYLPYADSFPNSRAGWTDELDREAYQVELTDFAQQQLIWLESQGVSQFRSFLYSQLEHDPLDLTRKRLILGIDKEGPHRIAYRTWRADFSISFEKKKIMIEELRSGYSREDLTEKEDPHSDKELHRQFTQKRWS